MVGALLFFSATCHFLGVFCNCAVVCARVFLASIFGRMFHIRYIYGTFTHAHIALRYIALDQQLFWEICRAVGTVHQLPIQFGSGFAVVLVAPTHTHTHTGMDSSSHRQKLEDTGFLLVRFHFL